MHQATASPTSAPPIRARPSTGKTSSITSTACCNHRTTAPVTRTTSPRNCHASVREVGRRLLGLLPRWPRALAETAPGLRNRRPPALIDTGGKSASPTRTTAWRKCATAKGKEKTSPPCITTTHHLTGIPLEAWRLRGQRQARVGLGGGASCVKIDKTSGIVNDANDWAIETMGNPKLPGAVPARDHQIARKPSRSWKALPTPGHLTATVAHRATNPDDTARLPIHAAPRAD